MDKAVVFDFDGVIIDSKNIQKEALIYSYNNILKKGNIPIEEFFKMSGSSLENIFETLNLPVNMIGEYRKYCIEHMDDIHLYDGAIHILQYLQNLKIKIGLCTGKDRIRTIQLLEKKHLAIYFDIVVCSDDVQNPKPDPESLLLCLNKLKIPAERACFVGDACNDIICAKKANVENIAVMWGEGKYNDIVNLSPDYIAYSFYELRTIINRWI